MRGAADERGITLQTLIVTAVLVLMAVAAGVVIVAITNSSSDDLEESGSDVQGRCTSVEIYDPVVASRNEKGVNIASVYRNFNSSDLLLTEIREIEGSAIGCIPVCIWLDRNPAGEAPSDGILQPGEVHFVRDLTKTDLEIKFERNLTRVRPTTMENNYILVSGSSRDDIKYLSSRSVQQNQQIIQEFTIGEVNGNGGVAGAIDKVRVASNQKECHTYDAGGNVLL